jgi:hypothetical protein
MDHTFLHFCEPAQNFPAAPGRFRGNLLPQQPAHRTANRTAAPQATTKLRYLCMMQAVMRFGAASKALDSGQFSANARMRDRTVTVSDVSTNNGGISLAICGTGVSKDMLPRHPCNADHLRRNCDGAGWLWAQFKGRSR